MTSDRTKGFNGVSGDWFDCGNFDARDPARGGPGWFTVRLNHALAVCV